MVAQPHTDLRNSLLQPRLYHPVVMMGSKTARIEVMMHNLCILITILLPSLDMTGDIQAATVILHLGLRHMTITRLFIHDMELWIVTFRPHQLRRSRLRKILATRLFPLVVHTVPIAKQEYTIHHHRRQGENDPASTDITFHRLLKGLEPTAAWRISCGWTVHALVHLPKASLDQLRILRLDCSRMRMFFVSAGASRTVPLSTLRNEIEVLRNTVFTARHIVNSILHRSNYIGAPFHDMIAPGARRSNLLTWSPDGSQPSMPKVKVMTHLYLLV